MGVIRRSFVFFVVVVEGLLVDITGVKYYG
jgi:hypothetical protein